MTPDGPCRELPHPFLAGSKGSGKVHLVDKRAIVDDHIVALCGYRLQIPRDALGTSKPIRSMACGYCRARYGHVRKVSTRLETR